MLDPWTKAQIKALADGPLAEMGFANPIEVSEWWQYGLRYHNGLRAIDFVIDVECGSIFVVLIRTLKSDKAADLLSLDNGHPMELAMACRVSGIECSRTPAKITSEQWQSHLPHAIAYDLQKLTELMAREGAWDKAISLVIEQYQRDTAFVESVVGRDQRLRMDGTPRQTGPSSHAAAPTLVISEWRMRWSMLGRAFGRLVLGALLSLTLLWKDPPIGTPLLVLVLIAAWWGLVSFIGIGPVLLARSVWRRADGALLLKVGPFPRGLIAADELRCVEVREEMYYLGDPPIKIFSVWLVSTKRPLRLTHATLPESECVAFANAVARAFGLETSRQLPLNV